jgi:hypothetical protein
MSFKDCDGFDRVESCLQIVLVYTLRPGFVCSISVGNVRGYNQEFP